jgi:hypothetical protein
VKIASQGILVQRIAGTGKDAGPKSLAADSPVSLEFDALDGGSFLGSRRGRLLLQLSQSGVRTARKGQTSKYDRKWTHRTRAQNKQETTTPCCGP